MKGSKEKAGAVSADTAPIKRDASLRKIDTTVPDEGCGRAELMRRQAERNRVSEEPAPKASAEPEKKAEK